MNEKSKGIIINLQVITFEFEEQKKDMLKVVYCVPMETTEKFSGNAILETYTNIDNLPILEKYILKPNLDIYFKKTFLKNGFKLSITKVNTEKLA